MEMKTKNASIDTMAVTIQALHVSGKMMTQSVFKQLPEFDLFLHRIDLIASMELWGMVSYRIKHGGNLWLIGSKDGIMYRIDTTLRAFNSVHASSKKCRGVEESPRH